MDPSEEARSPRDEAHHNPDIEVIPTGTFQANCYLVTCPTTGDTMVVDPGADAERILEHIRRRSLTVVIILHTHGHFDHIGATEAVLAGLGLSVPVAAHPADAYLYEHDARAIGAQFGYALPATLATPDVPLADGDELRVGELRLRVLTTPGHTPGSISLLCGYQGVFSGDTLFRRGIGRTDLTGSDEDAIYESILTRLYPLASELAVYPGHGPTTTIGEERRSNPFVQAP